MKPSHLSPSALLLSVSAFIAGPTFAQEKPQSTPSETPKKADAEPTSSEAPPSRSPSQFARQKAKDLRTRAAKVKKAGQHLVAERLEGAAAIWDKVAAHQESAAKLEADAAQIERKTLEIKSQARRAHSLVEQTETRRARALARLRELGLSESVETPSQAVDAAGAKDSKTSSESKAGSR